MYFLILKYAHIIGAAVLLGTGAGIAFFMLVAHLRGSPREIAGVSQTVVLADFIFTAPAVVMQPVTGVLLAWEAGYELTEGWILLSLILYGIVGVFWLPVVWMQMEMRSLSQISAFASEPLPKRYHRLFWTWFACGFPAFTAVLAIFWLMIARPAVGLS